jgi:hypothetical protein
MFIFEYGQGWADLVTCQMTVTRGSNNPFVWGYACLCIGSQFDPIIEQRYAEIDYVTGEYLHVFSMLPPPKSFLDERLKESRGSSDLSSAVTYERLTRLRNSKRAYPDSAEVGAKRRAELRHTMIDEKVRLLKELQEHGGMQVGLKADFLFFDFRRVGSDDDVDIDVIAAMQSPLGDSSTPSQYIQLFESMAKKAKQHYERADSVERFVKSLDISWSARIALNKTTNLKTFISLFVH